MLIQIENLQKMMNMLGLIMEYLILKMAAMLNMQIFLKKKNLKYLNQQNFERYQTILNIFQIKPEKQIFSNISITEILQSELSLRIYSRNQISQHNYAYSVLLPVSIFTLEQAMYHFIFGYTAKVAGTEIGVKELQATFSACFGETFLALHPTLYADICKLKNQEI